MFTISPLSFFTATRNFCETLFELQKQHRYYTELAEISAEKDKTAGMLTRTNFRIQGQG